MNTLGIAIGFRYFASLVFIYVDGCRLVPVDQFENRNVVLAAANFRGVKGNEHLGSSLFLARSLNCLHGYCVLVPNYLAERKEIRSRRRVFLNDNLPDSMLNLPELDVLPIQLHLSIDSAKHLVRLVRKLADEVARLVKPRQLGVGTGLDPSGILNKSPCRLLRLVQVAPAQSWPLNEQLALRSDRQ